MALADPSALGKRDWLSPEGGLAALARRSEAVVIPALALLAGLAVFGAFLLLLGKSPVAFYQYVLQAGYGSSFSWQNTLSRAAPLLFAALCVALSLIHI